MFLVDNRTLFPTAYMISFQCLFACFDWLFCAAVKAFRANFQVVSIFPEISKTFCLRICSQVLVSERLIMSKLMRRWKPLVAKNGDSLMEADSLLLAANLAIASFSNQSSY